MKFKEQQELVRNLRDLADFYERPRSIELPCPDIHIIEYPAVYGTITKIDAEGNKTHEYGVMVTESLNKLKKYVRVLGSCEKDYNDSYFKIKKRFGEHISLNFNVAREAICRKAPTGEVKVIEAYSSPERTEPVYEYICEDVSLLAPSN